MTPFLKTFLLSCGAVLIAAHPAMADDKVAHIEGDMPEEIRELMVSVIGTTPEEPRSLAQARRRVVQAQKSAFSVLRSQGYYGGTVEPKIIESDIALDTEKHTPPKAVLTVTPGPQFTFQTLDLTFSDTPPDVQNVLMSELGLTVGAPAIAAHVVAAELRVVNYLNAHGYPSAKALPRETIVDHAAQSMAVTFRIQSGQKTRFGEIIQTGTAKLSPNWPKMVAPFETGDVFDQRKLNTLSSRVIGTGVFESATAILQGDAESNTDGTITRNVMLNVDQGPSNTVSAELGFSTTDGSGVDLTYERRNFIGYAQSLTLSSTFKTNQLRFGAGYNIPFLFRDDRELDLSAEIAKEDTEAFSGKRATGTALVTQKFSKQFRVSAGLGLEASEYTDNGRDVTAYVVEGLGLAKYDTRDNVLDPQKGFSVEGALTPSYNFGEEKGVFTSVTLSGNVYERVTNQVVLAARLKTGTIIGTDFESIPLNRRFFAGGGGSVRGFGYQSIGPRDNLNLPSGGRSIIDGSVEARYRGDSPFGFAAFVDGGSVTRREYPDLQDVRFGAGVGLRYYTSFAPLRADIAIPLNPRDDDEKFQVYISIGQAF